MRSPLRRLGQRSRDARPSGDRCRAPRQRGTGTAGRCRPRGGSGARAESDPSVPARCASSAALSADEVVGMDAIDPFLTATDAGGRGQAKHRLPSGRAVELLAPKIPLPQPVIRAFRREREPLFASLEGVFRARALRDVMPEQRHAIANGEHSDLQRPRTRTRTGSARCASVRGVPTGQHLGDRARERRSWPVPASHTRVNDRAPVHGDSQAGVRGRRSRA